MEEEQAMMGSQSNNQLSQSTPKESKPMTKEEKKKA